MSYILKVENVVKSYNGNPALRGVDLHVREGSCFGLLGPNGAGKSTMMKIMTGILTPDQGEIELFGKSIRKESAAISRQVGYVPQEITLYEKLSAWQNLTFFGKMYGVRGEKLKERMKRVLGQVGLLERAGDAVGSYSGGMKRRINIAASLLHEPKLVILDEPTVGIDPQSRNHIFEMIRGLQRDGVTVIYSTHYMEEVEALCDEVAIIDHGAIVSQGGLRELLELHAIKAVYIETEGMVAAPSINGASHVRQEGAGWIVECERPMEMLGQLSRQYASSGRAVRALELMKPSLDSVFLKLTGTKLRD
ncbi:ABC transporter ATP-binding protein [Paenibacillus sp. L3-i20]|uniref:ABC transporter ATP-binding protein n=1 Tax=Paenibacillus sp. L3-i20 TaxID=2905833 RepID=UPI001EE08D5D|nr:ABC transporter ATP-binding protein [Paenibacillus sp. L3-i20]GKU77514.1 ABC transporter ATP-binding protein [Paenibacillus sp. L3-i20]